ncbi:hypothetical protein BX666DRAFT_1856130 [Dichotomocladium elegans]|nr:hypothetical protein BX666DRAFT_1856130 [Dichotomocladium elegans]
MDILEDTNFDIIVLGTGFPESIAAGALARAGKKVLHLDSNDFYGSNWSVFSIKDLLHWLDNRLDQSDTNSNVTLNNTEHAIHYAKHYCANFRNVSVRVHGASGSEKEEEISVDETALGSVPARCVEAVAADPAAKAMLSQLLRRSKSYNLDLTPKLLSCRGELVETLIRSGVGKYLEFKGVDDVCLFWDGALERVPSSKEDVFNNQAISLIDKRKLMRFLTFAVNFDEKAEILEGKRSPDSSNVLVSTRDGLEKTRSFIQSMGRFSKGGYLCPLYGGASEIAQAFCRVCAVFGGVYILNHPLKAFTVEGDRCTGITSADGQTFRSNWIVTNIDYLDEAWLPTEDIVGSWVSRAIVVSNKPLVSSEEETLSYSVLPPGSLAGNTNKPIFCIHQSAETMACPKGEYVTYLWKEGEEDAQDELQKAIDMLLPNDGCIRLSVFYQQRARRVDCKMQTWRLPSNVIACSDPDSSLDFEAITAEAIAAFSRCVTADTQFMPAQEREDVDDD